MRFRLCVESVQLFGNLLHGVFSVAEQHNFQAWTAKPNFAPTHQLHARLPFCLVQTNPGSESRCRRQFRFDHPSLPLACTHSRQAEFPTKITRAKAPDENRAYWKVAPGRKVLL